MVVDRNIDRKLEKELRDLEKRAERARVPGADAPFYNAAGDLCIQAGHTDLALEYYGHAVDAYLNAERWESAAAMCRKILRTSPNAVRARCTLAWLAIGKGFDADATAQVVDYVNAAWKAGCEEMAASQLRRMGEMSMSSRLRQAVAEQLLAIGADRAADHLFGTVYRDRHTVPERADDAIWSQIRRAALLGPQELANTDSRALRN